ncbi:DNA polymerase III subunit gamma/tau [Candidatus Saccharibacteria bacterium]|nr:DNA polymerase III subunit gamma/tau [Candidatus Saccharibacteria bacterium]
MSKALYRKYRPICLDNVVGQPQVTEPLSNSLKQGKVNHAYLFIGPRGTGKTSVARIFAHEVNGFKYEVEDDYVDIVEIDGASNRGIDNIRELREKAAIAPTSGKYKIYIIDEVHMLTKEAFNALLKTLEEPPKHVIFIMATTDAYKVPVTITSRAQTYTFKLADAKIMTDFLRKVADEEKIKIEDEALKIIVRRGGGSFRDSLSLLDQISTLSDAEITKELVISAMGLPEDEKILNLLDNYAMGDLDKISAALKDLLSAGVKPETIAEELIERIIAEPKQEFLSLLAKLPDVKAPFAEAKLLVALVSGRVLPEHPFSRRTFSSSTSYTGSQTEPPAPQANLSGPSRIYVSERENQKMPLKKDISDTRPAQTTQNIAFDWNSFVNKVQSLNDAVYLQLMKTSHELMGNTLHIYPEKKIVKTILSRDNNKRILSEAAEGVKIEIHEIDEKPTTHTKDEMLSKISDIMGGEVRNDTGGNPFEE